MMFPVIILLGLLFAVALAKHPRRRRKFRAYIRGGIEEVLGLSTLGAKTLTSIEFSDVVTESTWISSIIAAWTLSNLTLAAQDGPIMVGYAHSDYTDAEIEAFVEQTTSWNQGDLVSQEIAKRKIKIVGQLTPGSNVLEQISLNDGKPIRTKCNWLLTTGQSVSMWAYNMGDSALETTNAQVHIGGHANLWPR